MAAIALALDDGSMTGVWNVGTGRLASVNRVARLMRDAFGGAGGGIEYLPERPEIRQSCLDVGKLIGTGRWAPRIALSSGIIALATAMAAAS